MTAPEDPDEGVYVSECFRFEDGSPADRAYTLLFRLIGWHSPWDPTLVVLYKQVVNSTSMMIHEGILYPDIVRIIILDLVP